MGSTMNPPVSLAPFAFDWVGGDIHGLQALSIRLSSYVPAIVDVTTDLDRRAGQLTSDGRAAGRDRRHQRSPRPGAGTRWPPGRWPR
jgi:hypothetical protein